MIPLAATLGRLLAAAEAAAPDLSGLAQYPIAAVFAGVSWYLFRALMETLKLERARADRLETLNQTLNTAMHDRIIPALMASTTESAAARQATAEAVRVLQTRKDTSR